MKAAVVPALKQPLVIEDRPIPIPGEGEVLVKDRSIGSVSGHVTARLVFDLG